MARKDIINQNGVPNWDAIAGFKERLDGHDGQLAQKVSQINGTKPDANGNITLPIADTNTFSTKSDVKSIGLVTAYGAVGNGSSPTLASKYATLAQAQVDFPSAVALTDDLNTLAIQKCHDDNSVVEFPAGTFITKSINITKRIKIRGQGEATIVQAHPSATGNLFNVKSGYIAIESLRVDGNNGSGNGPSINAIGDTDTTRSTSNAFEQVKLTDVSVFNVKGSAFYFIGRGMDYVFTRLFVYNVTEYGIHMGETGTGVSDSQLNGCHLGGVSKTGIYITNGNTRILGTKVCLSGSAGYPAIHLNGALYVSLSGCELQQNCYDGLLIQNGGGHLVTSTIFDSNNMVGLSGVYGQINVKTSLFNRISGLIVDGRFGTGQASPYNMAPLYGVVTDDKSPYCSYDMSYSPYSFTSNSNLTRLIPYYSTVNDITSVFKLNNTNYLSYPSNSIVIGTNAVFNPAGHGGTINASGVSSNGGTQADYTMQAGASLVGGTDYFFLRLVLTSNQFNLTGKSKVYVSYQSKVLNGCGISVLIGESDSVNTTISESGMVNITNVNYNTQFMYGAGYKPLSYSNNSGFTVYLDVTINVTSNITVNQNDILASLKNINVSFV